MFFHAFLSATLLTTAIAGTSVAADHPRAAVHANDNQHPAGTLARGTLTLALRAAAGTWRPEGPAGPSLDIEAFGEAGKPLSVPAPLIRVVEGTQVVATVRNELAAELVVHGLCTRGADACAPLKVPAGETREVRFSSGPAGTYHYWASTLGAPVPFRELAGAFVVDPPRAAADRILVITEWTNLTRSQLREIMTSEVPTETFVALAPKVTFVMNGLSWPATERLTYDLGVPVRWRVINLSSQAHPLHLHGFYFDVDSLGDGMSDKTFDVAHRRKVVTQLLPSGGTMSLTWTPERAGNWLFHCHIMHHVSPNRRIAASGRHDGDHAAHDHGAGDAALGMAGMVIGVTVREPHGDMAYSEATGADARKLTLVMRPAGEGGTGAGFILREGEAPASSAPSAPGPPIVLRRGEPVEITLLNELKDATSIHWHGIELDSYYDGVHGYSGAGRQVAPMIEAGGRFVVRFTPPRAGTFIYHTHLHDYRQLSAGLYGPLIVVDADGTFDPNVDHVVVLGRSGLVSEEPSLLTDPASVVINGSRDARLVWRSGTRHRVRLINITPDDIFEVALQTSEAPVTWRPLAKDGAPLPAGETGAIAARQIIAVGETYEFEYEAPAGQRTLWLNVRTTGGKWQAQARVIVR